MWTYNSRTGALSHDGVFAGECYSGFGSGLNNPDLERDVEVGPIPRGRYRIGIWFDDQHGKGPLVAHLYSPDVKAKFGRDGFMVHGDNRQLDHTASRGCIIAAHVLRLAMANSQDQEFEVVAE